MLHTIFRMLAVLAAVLAASFHGPAAAGPAGSDRGADLLDAEVLHGTVQARVNGRGDLVIGLDRKRSALEPEDGTADVVFLTAPLGDASLDAAARSLAGPVAGATLETSEGRLRLVTPDGGAMRFTVGRDQYPEDGHHPGEAVPVVGIARYVVDRRGLALPEALDAFEGFSVVGGRVGQRTPEAR